MENISVNNLVESTNSNLPRDIKVEFAKNILSSIKNPEDAKKEFELLINKLSLKKQRLLLLGRTLIMAKVKHMAFPFL